MGNKPTVVDLLPQPFAWIEIPGKGYSIAKYPVTNAQFARFIEAKCYENKKWWTDAGWQVKEEKYWIQPGYWTDQKWNGAEYPVVGVSWVEAVAFCLWLSDVTGENIMLPSDDQWQYAAQGEDGREYPWGDVWDDSRCNNSVGKDWQKNSTSPVRQYEGVGDSPFGVVDMAGNVWEWCLTDFDTQMNDINSSADMRMAHGGAWNYEDADHFRVNFHIYGDPGDRYEDVGFRLVRS